MRSETCCCDKRSSGGPRCTAPRGRTMPAVARVALAVALAVAVAVVVAVVVAWAVAVAAASRRWSSEGTSRAGTTRRHLSISTRRRLLLITNTRRRRIRSEASRRPLHRNRCLNIRIRILLLRQRSRIGSPLRRVAISRRAVCRRVDRGGRRRRRPAWARRSSSCMITSAAGASAADGGSPRRC